MATLAEKMQANEPLLRQLHEVWSKAVTQGGGIEDMLGDLGRQLMQAQGAESGASSALETARAAPMPETPPMAQAVTRSLANLAGSLTGSEAPRQNLDQLINRNNQMLLARRAENLAMLEDAYKRAAARAEKLGDLENQIKLGEKVWKTHAEMDVVTKNWEALQRHTFEMEEIGARTGAEERLFERRAELEKGLAQSRAIFEQQQRTLMEEGDTRRAYITQGLNPDDPTKPLMQSKAYRIGRAARVGFIPTDAWATRYFGIVNAAEYKNWGNVPIHKKEAIRSNVLNLAPDMAFATDPDGWLERMANLRAPNGEFLFPHDAAGDVKEPYVTKMKAHMRTWFSRLGSTQ